jgi:hydroxypyruvate isomerase
MLIAANTGFLWTDLPFPERIRRARDAGFSAVEFHDEAQGADLAEVARVLAETGLPVLGLNTRMGATTGCAAVPGMEAQARADIDDAVRVAKALGARAIHVTAGRAEGDEARFAFIGALIHALDSFAGTILIEPISRNAVPGYFLSSLHQARDIADTVNHPRLQMMFDVFHVRALGYNILKAAEEFLPFIGHVQLSGWPDRDEPDLAGSMISILQSLGYGGDFGAEYRPRTGSVEAGLGWLESLG